MIRHKTAALAAPLACSMASAIVPVAAAASSISALRTVAEQSGDNRLHRSLRRSRTAVPGLSAAMATTGTLLRVRPHARRGGPCSRWRRRRTAHSTRPRAHRAGRPVAAHAGWHSPGEIDGKDAGFLALRQMLEGSLAKDALKNVTLVFVPVFNIDGHERFGRWNRPNQVGPEEMGWRATAAEPQLESRLPSRPRRRRCRPCCVC